MPAGERRPREKDFNRWGVSRRVVQWIILILFLVLALITRRGMAPSSLVDLPFRLDPLSMLANAVASRSIISGALLGLVTLLLTLVLGRVWCGWICPLGTVLDLFKFRNENRGRRPSEVWRSVKYLLLISILIAAVVSNLTLLIFDPINLLIRSISTSLLPAVDTAFTAVEKVLFQIPAFQDPLARLDGWIRPLVLPQTPAVYHNGVLFAAVFFVVIGLNLIAPRFWCRSLCPLGALLGLVSKTALIRRQVNDSCQTCGACARRCPTGTIDPENHYRSDPGECIVCMECVDSCPAQGNTFQFTRGLAAWNSYDPGRRQVFSAAAAVVAGVAVAQSAVDPARPHPHLIQPPGSRDNDLMVKCIRCGLCSRACPTNAIQPAVTEAGLVGIWTPVLVMRSGYCDYSCNACGQVCPVQAIPPLDLEEKRVQVLGYAVIDQNRCIPWSQRAPCIVCEEMCPVPEKAITLETLPVSGGASETGDLKAPRVMVDQCIGCGICEYRCPVAGEAAIRVYSTSPFA